MDKMESNVQYVVKDVSKFDGKNVDDFLKWSSRLRVSQSFYSKSIFEIVQGPQRPLDLDNDQTTARGGWDDANHNLYTILYFTTSRPSFLCRQLGMDRTHGWLYERSSTAAHARPCERRTEKWKR